MAVLSSNKILEEKNTRDPNSITSLSLTHRALSDVSCLAEFKNLERLDLGFNNLTSLEGLKSCVNLKWLSVVQNKLQSLKGVEGLTKLTVLNAGKNKLNSMDEVRSLVSFRALILNDNEIGSICKLDQMKELNTLVLSRNPIRTIGDSLVKLKSISKLSLSSCQLQTIDSSLKSCTELKELRLAHNEIKTLPSDLACLLKLQNLDIGNNLIMNWSDLKVLSSLVSLKNLNLQGNPAAEKENLVKKVKKLVHNLQIFNAKPIEKSLKEGRHGVNSSVNVGNELAFETEKNEEHEMVKKKSKKRQLVNEGEDARPGNVSDIESNGGLKLNKQKKYDSNTVEKLERNENYVPKELEIPATDPGVRKKTKRKKEKKIDVPEKPSRHKLDGETAEKEPEKKSRKRAKGNNIDIIDDAEAPFLELFDTDDKGKPLDSMKTESNGRSVQDVDAVSGLVTFPKKKKKLRNSRVDFDAFQSPGDEIGLGGPSTWDDV